MVEGDEGCGVCGVILPYPECWKAKEEEGRNGYIKNFSPKNKEPNPKRKKKKKVVG